MRGSDCSCLRDNHHRFFARAAGAACPIDRILLTTDVLHSNCLPVDCACPVQDVSRSRNAISYDVRLPPMTLRPTEPTPVSADSRRERGAVGDWTGGSSCFCSRCRSFRRVSVPRRSSMTATTRSAFASTVTCARCSPTAASTVTVGTNMPARPSSAWTRRMGRTARIGCGRARGRSSLDPSRGASSGTGSPRRMLMT